MDSTDSYPTKCYRDCSKSIQRGKHNNVLTHIQAVREKPGSTHIELSQDVAAMEVDENKFKPIPARIVRPPDPDPSAVAEAWEIIKSAKHPLILAGNGVIRMKAHKHLTEFVNTTGIGVISTFMAKGAISCDNEHCMFATGIESTTGQPDLLEDPKTDVVIAVGYDLVEYHAVYWNAEKKKTIVHVDVLEAEVDDNYQTSCEVVGDIQGYIRKSYIFLNFVVLWKCSLNITKRILLSYQTSITRDYKV